MTTEALLAQAKGLEVQIAVLKAQLKSTRSFAPPPSFAELEGILSGKAESTEREIEEAEFQEEWTGMV